MLTIKKLSLKHHINFKLFDLFHKRIIISRDHTFYLLFCPVKFKFVLKLKPAYKQGKFLLSLLPVKYFKNISFLPHPK